MLGVLVLCCEILLLLNVADMDQGVVTPIGAILKAATGDTICVRLNLAVTQ